MNQPRLFTKWRRSIGTPGAAPARPPTLSGYTYQPAMGSKIYAKGGVLVPSEHHIGAFHDWIQEKVGDVVPTT